MTDSELEGWHEKLAAERPADSVLVDDAIEIADSDLATEAQIEAAMLTEGLFRRPPFWASVIWTLLLLAAQVVVGLAMVMVAAVIVMVTNPLAGQDPNRMTRQIEQAMSAWLLPVSSFSTMVIAFVIVLSIYRGHTARCMGLRGLSISQSVLILLLALPMTVLTSEFTNCVAELLPPMPMMELFADFATQPLALIFLAGCVFPGIGEELFFRGFLSRGMVSRNGVVWGTIGTAFLFGAVHIHPIQASGAFLLGIALQLAFQTTRSLWGAALLHTANNALAFFAMRYGSLLPIDGFTIAPDDEILHTPPVLVFSALVAAIMVAYVLYRTRTQWVLPDGQIWSGKHPTAEAPLPEVGARPRAGTATALDSLGILLTYGAFLLVTSYCVKA